MNTMNDAVLSTPVTRWQVDANTGSASELAATDSVSAECAIALVFNGISHTVMMATPRDLVELALGFALSEGIIDSRADWRSTEVIPATAAGIEVHMEISPRCFARLKTKRRTMAGTTGCGLCGIESLNGLAFDGKPILQKRWQGNLKVATILKAVALLPEFQVHNAATGSLHAAAWATPDGRLTTVLEDVGRHNALDKLIGTISLPQRGFAVMSSRASVELVRKCVQLQIPALAVISAPTSLAIALAQQTNLQLWGMCRPPTAVRYN
jgi:FdhD protein